MGKRKGFTLVEMLAMIGVVFLLGLVFLIWDELERTTPLDVRSATYKYGKYDVSFGKTKELALCKCKRHAIAEDPEFKDSEEFPMGVYISGCDWEADPNHVDIRQVKQRWVPDDHEFLKWDREKMGEIARFILEKEAGKEVKK